MTACTRCGGGGEIATGSSDPASPCMPCPRCDGTGEVRTARRLSKRKLYAILDALNFLFADEWCADSHDERGDYNGAHSWALQELAKRERA